MSPRRVDGDQAAIDEIRSLARPLRDASDLAPLLDRIGDARYVLLGEASHGTSEYYRWRGTISRRLIEERGFSFVAVEGDWPDCYEVHRWVTGDGDPADTAAEVLARFDRWPTWMWANEEVAEFADWLRSHNERTGAQVGFFGLDVYSLWESLDRLLRWVHEHEPSALDSVLRAVRCFEPYGEDPQRYANATRMIPETCEPAVIDVLREIRGAGGRTPERGSDERLDLVQNAEVLAGAERYYRAMVRANAESWNVRDCHMVETLERLVEHHGPDAKAIVWEHNTHVGDARATDMAAAGMLNVGQVVRERHADDGVVLVGFGGHDGSVVAGRSWGAPARRMPVPPARDGSHEHLIAQVTSEPTLFVFPDERDSPWLSSRRGHRAIGVVYEPERDAWGNWVPTVLGRRYDAFVSFGRTEALHPLHAEPEPHGELDTYPWSA